MLFKKKIRYGLLFLGSLLAGISLFGMFILPVFDDKSRYNVNDKGFKDDVSKVGSIFDDPEPFNYYYLPGNTFGVEGYNVVNQSFFWAFFENNTDWTLWFTNKLNDPWEDVTDEALEVEYIVNDSSISQKMILNFTAPSTGYYRLNYTMNSSAGSYWFDNVSEYGLNINIPNSDKNYTVDFNWSDIVDSSWHEYLEYSHGLVDDKFFFDVFITTKITANSFISIDPEFGHKDTAGDGNSDAEWRIWGSLFQFTGTTGSTATDLGGFIRSDDEVSGYWRFALYYGNNVCLFSWLQ